MAGLLLDWLNAILRWLHLITGIAWVGASFYFIWLDNSLRTPPEWKKQKGVAGDLWAFHGGGIYEVAKYKLAPETMPITLHWFKWEAYSTWITGSLLLIVLYYFQADLYLVKVGGWISSPGLGIVASIVFLASGYGLYEILLRLFATRQTLLFVILLSLCVVVYCWLSVELFSDRAAYLHVGALLATIMVANVFVGIIPPQKNFVKALEAGQAPDQASMLFAKQRSVLNNYFTLPVLFCMISNHYAFIYGHRYNWLILVAIIAITAYARHFFNLRQRDIFKPSILIIAFTLFIVLVALMHWDQTAQANHAVLPINNALQREQQLMQLVSHHCAGCHAQAPTQPGFAAAPAGMVFENIDQVTVAKDRIITAVSTNYMPLANITGMTEPERQIFLALLTTSL